MALNNWMRPLRAGLLLAALAAGALGWRQARGQYDAAMQAMACTEVQQRAAGLPAGVAFSLALSRPVGTGGAAPAFGLVNLPGPEGQTGPAVLFLPGAAKTAGLRAETEAPCLLDGQPLESGQPLLLAEGPHQLHTSEGTLTFTAVYGSALPCVFLETASGSLEEIQADKYYGESAAFTLLDAGGGLGCSGWAEAVRGHGNGSWLNAQKRSYQVTLAEKAGLLEMPAARRWLLIANAFDKSLLRNQTAFALARAAGAAFTPESRQVELYVNGEYQGCYLLCEKVEVGADRVDIPSLEKLNLAAALDTGQTWEEEPRPWQSGQPGLPGHRRYTGLEELPGAGEGGWLLELELPERYLEDHKPGFVSRLGQPVCVQSPASASRQQVEEMAALYQRLEDALCPAAEGSAESLERLIDLRSFARKYLVEEITKNLDASMSSQYLYKLPDAVSPRLYAGPVWDYDKSLAGSGTPWEDLAVIADPEGFWANQQQTGYTLWSALYDQPAFRAAVEESFWQDFVPAADLLLGEGLVVREARRLADSAVMDAMRWQGGGYPYDPDTFLEEYLAEAEKIEAFLAARMAWLQGQWPKDAAA